MVLTKKIARSEAFGKGFCVNTLWTDPYALLALKDFAVSITTKMELYTIELDVRFVLIKTRKYRRPNLDG